MKLNPLWSLRVFLAPYRLTSVLAFAALLVASVFYLSMPIVLRTFFDYGLGTVSVSPWLLVGTFLLTLGFAVTSAWRFYLVSWLGERVVADLRVAVFSQVLFYDLYQLEVLQVGDILSRLTADTVLVEQIVGTSLSMALRNLISLIGGAVMIFITSWRLALLVMLLTPCVVLPIFFVLRWQRRLSRDSQDALAHSNAYASEVLHAVDLSQAFCHQQEDIRKYQDYMEAVFVVAGKRIWARALLTVLMVFLIISAFLVVLWSGLWFLQHYPEWMSPGLMAQFVGYAVIVAVAAAALGEVWGDLQRASGASERLQELLQMSGSSSQDHSHFVEIKQYEIRLENVCFAYQTRPDFPVLRNINLTIPAGKVTALVGPSGAGKTTVLQLLLRFYDVDKGRISIGGQDVESLSLDAVRKCVSVVPQDVTIFSGSVEENIRYGDPEASFSSVLQAAKRARVDAFVCKFPDKYATQVGEQGVRLSGGQKQRIALARAFLKDTPILVLDEATSSLDSKNEALIQEALGQLIQNRTTIVVAHRLSTVQKADQIVFLDQGSIQACGDHQTLLGVSQAYAEFVKMQWVEE